MLTASTNRFNAHRSIRIKRDLLGDVESLQGAMTAMVVVINSQLQAAGRKLCAYLSPHAGSKYMNAKQKLMIPPTAHLTATPVSSSG